MNRLDRGEQEAIFLAYEMDLPLLIEETIGRRVAQSLGLAISGIAGQILKATKEKLIEKITAYSMVQQLLSSGRINRRIDDMVRSELQKS